MKYIIQVVLMTFTLCWLSACTNPFLVSPGITPSPTPPFQLALSLETVPATVSKSEANIQGVGISPQPSVVSGEVVESVSRSPLASPTATPLSKEPTLVKETPVMLPTATSTAKSEKEPTPETVQPPATSVPIKETPAPTIVVISDEPLLSAEQLSAMDVNEDETVSVVAWPVENEMILQVGNQPEATTWRVTTDKGVVQQVPNLQTQETAPLSAIQELQKYNEAVDYAVVSPDGQWAAWAAWETLLVKRLGTDAPPIDLLGVEYERFEGGSNTFVWSPDSKKIAYAVKNDNAGYYEIRINDPLGKNVKVLPLWNTSPSPILWSPDGQYLAFKSLDQPQTGINNIYLFRRDGNTLTQLTQNGLAKTPIHWSPTSTAIVYTHGKGDGSNPWLVTFEIR
jgi:hypothetical protein